MPMVEQSTSIFGVCFRPSRNMPSGPKQTSARSLPVLSIVKSTSTSASSERAATTLAPFSSAVSALARVRFQIETSYPALTSRAAIGAPMRPTPIHPIFMLVPLRSRKMSCGQFLRVGASR